MSETAFTVTFLMNAFRRALQAMAPIAESVGLTWRDSEAYDEWDALAESLFDVLVVSAVMGDVKVAAGRAALSRYGYGPPPAASPAGSWIEVDVPEMLGTYSFVAFGSNEDFGKIHVARVDHDGPGATAPASVPWTPNRTFGVWLRAPGRPGLRVDRVTPTESVWPIPRGID